MKNSVKSLKKKSFVFLALVLGLSLGTSFAAPPAEATILWGGCPVALKKITTHFQSEGRSYDHIFGYSCRQLRAMATLYRIVAIDEADWGGTTDDMYVDPAELQIDGELQFDGDLQLILE